MLNYVHERLKRKGKENKYYARPEDIMSFVNIVMSFIEFL